MSAENQPSSLLPKRQTLFSDPNQPVKNKAHMCSQETPNSLRPDFFEIRRALGWMGLLEVPANLGLGWGGRLGEGGSLLLTTALHPVLASGPYTTPRVSQGRNRVRLRAGLEKRSEKDQNQQLVLRTQSRTWCHMNEEDAINQGFLEAGLKPVLES